MDKVPFKIAAVYTSYFPDINRLYESIKLLYDQVNNIVIIDNSPIFELDQYKFIISQFNVNVISCNGNTGIADALNRGCLWCKEQGYDWIVTMDQDSLIQSTLIETYHKFLSDNVNLKIGALTPYFIPYFKKEQIRLTTKETTEYMTSGSLINLKAYSEVGGFNDSLFIDMVDTDYGLRLIKNNYKIFRIGGTLMKHSIGNATEFTLFGKHIRYITHHNYIRRYYITRNILWLAKKYGKEYPQYNHPYWAIFKSFIRLLFFETDKRRKVKSILKGINDYKHNHYGKFEL